MAKQENLVFTGEVIEELGNAMFKVELDLTGAPNVLCTISGRMRKNFIRVLVGDMVEIEVSPYDPTRGRITKRLPITVRNQS